MTNDDATTGALFLGGGLAGYALGRLVIARWLDDRSTRPPPAPSIAPIAPIAPTPAPLPAPPLASGSTVPAPAAPPTQARPTPTPSRPSRRPQKTPHHAATSTEADVGPVTSPSQVEPSASPPADGPVTSPAQVDATATRAPIAWSTGSATYDRRAAQLIASIPRRVERTRELIAQWSTYLDRYRGGLPRGVFAAVMQMESDGRPGATGDASLGEVGLFQITEALPRSLGLDPQLRRQNAWNFYLAGTEYNQAAWRWHQRYPELIGTGSRDAWLFARLSFAIGDGGARWHVKRALRAEPDLARSDGVYAALSTFVRHGGARKAGSQSPEKIAYRIAVAVPTSVEIGERAEPGSYGAPVRLSPPTT